MKQITIRCAQPNVGIQIAYRKKLRLLIREMCDSYKSAVSRWYAPQVITARDAAPDDNDDDKKKKHKRPPSQLYSELEQLERKWRRRFERQSYLIAVKTMDQVFRYTDAQLKSKFKAKDMRIKLKMTRAMQQQINTIVRENVSLIKSIPAQYHTNVESTISAGFGAGKDLQFILRGISRYRGITERRAKMITNDQVRKATSNFERTRQLELGITKGIWRHTHRKESARASHVAANGRVYDLAKGCLIDGEYIQVGQKINCVHPSAKGVFVHNCKRLFRHHFTGDIIRLYLTEGQYTAITPNHPIFIDGGWRPAKDLKEGDKVTKLLFEKSEVTPKKDITTSDPTIREIFDAAAALIRSRTGSGAPTQFHGDGSDQKVDIIDIDSFLMGEIDTAMAQEFLKQLLADTEIMEWLSQFGKASPFYLPFVRLFSSSQSSVCILCQLLALLKTQFAHSDELRRRTIAWVNAVFNQTSPNNNTTDIKLPSNSLFTQPSEIETNDLLIRQVVSFIVRMASGNEKCSHEEVPIIRIERVPYSGYVYNFETVSHQYYIGNFISHNCQCLNEVILPFYE